MHNVSGKTSGEQARPRVECEARYGVFLRDSKNDAAFKLCYGILLKSREGAASSSSSRISMQKE
jgi:hypothetical protein